MRPHGDAVDAKLWEIVAKTVRPLRGRVRLAPPVARPEAAAAPAAAETVKAPPPAGASRKTAGPPPQRAQPAPRPLIPAPPAAIEPGRRRRLERGREAAPPVLDLHGMNQDQARAALTGFVIRSHADHQRHLLVVTGKGALGDGVLRRRAPEWLAEPPLRALVAGVSEAHRRHGGGGALYIALKRPHPKS